MNSIVLNLRTLAVTEADPSLTGIDGPFETAADGVYKTGGEEAVTGTVSWGMNLSELRQRPKYLYLFGTNLKHAGPAQLTVNDAAGKGYTYRMAAVHERVGRFEIGRGIRDNYLGMTLVLQSTKQIVIDAIDDQRERSINRRL